MSKTKLISRDISWLAFNDRVLQEAADKRVPLLERLRFIGIFSSNRDEFFRVRMATLKRIVSLGKKGHDLLGHDPNKVMKEVQKAILTQQIKFDKIYADLMREMNQENIILLNEKELDIKQQAFVKRYFYDKVRPALVPIMLSKKNKFPNLKDRSIYLAIKLFSKKINVTEKYALMEIPSRVLPRFIILPSTNTKVEIILLDDIIRFCLKELFAVFRFEYIEAFCIKLTRDAEIEINEYDFSKSVPEKMAKSLQNRKKGRLVHFIYDKNMSDDLLRFIISKLKLKESDNLIPGGRYHNFKDYLHFPNVGQKNLNFPVFQPLLISRLEKKSSILDEIKKNDVFLSYPYQSFTYIIDLLREAAIDPNVTSIKINLYRVAKDSKIINALINAAYNGKRVTAVIELKARFDEEANLQWAAKLQDEGIRVIHGVPHLKVHSKLLVITRTEGKKNIRYAHIGTGNFNEETAELYCDYSLLTANSAITNEVNKVFDFFKNNIERGNFRHLLLSPFNMRRKLYALIDQEIEHAQNGKEAYIILKLNNLSDREIIKKLYEASAAGVKIKLLIRGICSLMPGELNLSENIEAYSIIDRFLEHARVFVFANAGKEKYYISSADLMPRNLDYRVEVACPILDPNIVTILKKQIAIQLSPNIKTRILDKDGKNRYSLSQQCSADLDGVQAKIYKLLTINK